MQRIRAVPFNWESYQRVLNGYEPPLLAYGSRVIVRRHHRGGHYVMIVVTPPQPGCTGQRKGNRLYVVRDMATAQEMFCRATGLQDVIKNKGRSHERHISYSGR